MKAISKDYDYFYGKICFPGSVQFPGEEEG